MKQQNIKKINESQIREIVAETLKSAFKKFMTNDYSHIQAPEEFKSMMKQYGWDIDRQREDGSIRIIPRMDGASFQEMVNAIRQAFPNAMLKNGGDYCLVVKFR